MNSGDGGTITSKETLVPPMARCVLANVPEKQKINCFINYLLAFFVSRVLHIFVSVLSISVALVRVVS